MTPTIFTIGSATFDIFVKPSDQVIFSVERAREREKWLGLAYGGKVKIDEVIETFGGGATNTAVGFSRLGFQACCVAKIGEEYGSRVISNLEKENVKTDFIARDSHEKTGFSTIINTFDGDRTVLAYSGANHLFGPKDLPLKAMARADWIFLSHTSGPTKPILQTLLKFLKKNPRIRLAWNPGYEQLSDGARQWATLLKRTDALFLNKEEAALFSRKSYRLAGVKNDPHCHLPQNRSFFPSYADDVQEIIKALLRYGVKNVVITDGRNGAQGSDGKHLYFCPVISHKRVDTLGAGDAFATGFTTALIEGKGLKEALIYGTLNANSVVSYYGAQRGLLTGKALKKQLTHHPLCVTSTAITD